MFGLTKTKKSSQSPTQKTQSRSSDSLSDSLGDNLGDGLQSASSLQGSIGSKSNEAATTHDNNQKAAEQEEKAKKPGLFDKMFKTDKWKKDAVNKAGDAMLAKGVAGARPYWSELATFAEKEFSGENLDAHDAIKGGADARSIYNIFIKVGSPNQVNLPNSAIKPLAALADKDQFDQMNFTEALMQIDMNIADTISRFRWSKEFEGAALKRASRFS
jgi:hypothetical protein